MLASYTYEGSVILWDLSAGKKTATLVSARGGPWSLAFTPDAKSLVVIGRRPAKEGEQEKDFPLCSAKVWDLATQKVRLTIDFPEAGTGGGLITPDGKFLIAGGPTTDMVWYDLNTGKPSDTVQMDKDHRDIRTMALSPDGKTLAVGTQSSGIILWNLEKKSTRATITAARRRIDALAFSPDGKTLASAYGGDGVDLWDAGNGQATGQLSFNPRVILIRQIAFSPDGKTLAVGGLRWGVSLADLAAGGERDDFEGDVHTALVLCVIFTPDGKTLITGGTDKEKAIWFWDVPQGKCKGVKSSDLTQRNSSEIPP